MKPSPSQIVLWLSTLTSKKNKAKLIPSVVHVDMTSRMQVVDKKINARYHKLIYEFKKLTGIPMVLNTSFNEHEPIVCTPKEAVQTFLRTTIDYLVMNNYLILKKSN